MRVVGIERIDESCFFQVFLENGSEFTISGRQKEQHKLVEGAEVVLGDIDSRGESVYFNGQHVANIP